MGFVTAGPDQYLLVGRAPGAHLALFGEDGRLAGQIAPILNVVAGAVRAATSPTL